MATYTDTATFRRDFVDITDDEIFSRVLTRAATIAYDIINGYLNGIYSVPFSSTPALILDISDMFTKALAFVMANRGAQKLDEMPEYKIAMDLLKDVQSGVIDMSDATRTGERTSEHTMDDFQPIFDLDDSLKHKVDEDYLTDIADRRGDV